jgi:hypothetical protein
LHGKADRPIRETGLLFAELGGVGIHTGIRSDTISWSISVYTSGRVGSGIGISTSSGIGVSLT